MLVLLVLLVDAIFIAIYFLVHLRETSGGVKLLFTIIWTLVNLAVVIRGLSRIRSARTKRNSA